jgi:hypothetical protein
MPELSFVAVLNPLHPRASQLSYAHARRYVRQGRAEWVKGTSAIRFVETNHLHQSAARLARQQTALGYDQRGMLLLEEVRRLPCLEAERLFAGRKREA